MDENVIWSGVENPNSIRDARAKLAGGRRLSGIAKAILAGKVPEVMPDQFSVPDKLGVDVDGFFRGWAIRPSDFAGGADALNLTNLTLAGIHSVSVKDLVTVEEELGILTLPLTFSSIVISGNWEMAGPVTKAGSAPDEIQAYKRGTIRLNLNGLAVTARMSIGQIFQDRADVSFESVKAVIDDLCILLEVEGVSEFLNRLINGTVNADAIREKLRIELQETLCSKWATGYLAAVANRIIWARLEART